MVGLSGASQFKKDLGLPVNSESLSGSGASHQPKNELPQMDGSDVYMNTLKSGLPPQTDGSDVYMNTSTSSGEISNRDIKNKAKCLSDWV